MRAFFFISVLLFLASLSVSGPGVWVDVAPMEPVFSTANTALSDGELTKNNPFESLAVEAEAAAVLDLSNDKFIFQKNSDLERPLASLTKLITAAVIYDIGGSLLSEGAVIIPMTADAVLQEGDDGFLVGESFNAKDLMDSMLVRSSNDAAFALALWAKENGGKPDGAWFVNEMNLFVSRLGLQKTYFLNPTGLDMDDRLSGAYGNAEETARLFSWILKNHPDLISATSRPQITIYSLVGKKHIFESSAKPIMPIPELIAAKTGYTELAGGNLVFAYGAGPGSQFVAVILGSSYEGRFSDALKLYEATLAHVKNL
ncbi:MAG: hypothetical protein A2931_00785 [Candidatus Niyogibacteria bacterium RIFCSPLOWO2_01_FULL_45_48]|uniref:Peptidase S11 D-alanyl-D-alanine carboxypeptidase A N-terminal domain-containing protein n=2 Tax=Candidatus Niyogiibacteriota TaxID=1817912 RepID=A0A1G2F0Q7_9BACT|nr:MAG: hypothetical protein A2931_00785 [Candidatus Niyogibacteria bacterium RIFCSPLOWO2_01_FULL_45_48]OGZ30551.1 MAG: hypothetical protein A2835_02570 [Candidatus Niyogibacteria bacterium RIFCSPHIGHO2_01_FULL_45_28]OGZ31655.1 MAG: hypothetical protein A3J00_00395 [Candidatus Niyogibacteria bacterium RIFCSPLOWO2_02_FULL_45_13]